MATSNAFNEKVEAILANLLREEYPHMRTSSVNHIASGGAQSMAWTAENRFREDCANIRKLDFLDLPRELRDRVYEFAVAPDKDAVTINLDYWQCGDLEIDVFMDKGPLQPPITKVCRQLRCEALPLYYELNEFAVSLEVLNAFGTKVPVDGPAVVARWLKAIGPENIKHICKLVVFARKQYMRRRSSNVTLQRFLDRKGVELAEKVQVRLIQ
ncbi:hypothetical protein LTR08_005746 [Meristemomyces frigidus]|nr:hypothetical protein LTR08_005746 [Meristemomyces frigidus]